jgi:hypothetical protein
MNHDAGIVIFLLTQAGLLIWILSRHDAQIQNLIGWMRRLEDRGDVNGRNIGVLEGINEGERKV